MNEVDLLRLKKQIEETKEGILEDKGHQKALLKQLKDTWKCNTIQEANILLRKIEKSIEKYNESIEQGMKELEEKY